MLESMQIKVSIVEDVSEIRESLVTLIGGSTGFTCVSSYGTGKEAMARLVKDKPDVVLMDINLPDMSGIDCVAEFRKRRAPFQMLMLTMYEDGEQVFRALASGATGYLLKRTPPAKLLEAISEAMQGGSPMSMQIARMVVQSFHGMEKTTNEKANLTPREEEILSHLAKGLRYKEIADALYINIETVRSHLRRIYEKLQVRSGTEAVLKYLQK